MRHKLAFGALFFMLYVNCAFGQTASDIETRYGKPINAYSVGERIWMTPEYTTDGEVCRMRLYPKRIYGNTNYHSKELDFEEFNKAVDQLVPFNMRGAKKEPFGKGGWTTGGGAMWAIFTYEKVRIMYSAGFRVDPDSSLLRKPFEFTVLDFPPPDAKAESPTKPEDDFLSYQKSRVEIVTITWEERKCAEN